MEPEASKPTAAVSAFAAEAAQRQPLAVATASHLTLQVAVFDRGKAPASHSSEAPFLATPHIQLTTAANPATGGGWEQQAFSLRVPSVSISATPRQLQVCPGIFSLERLHPMSEVRFWTQLYHIREVGDMHRNFHL